MPRDGRKSRPTFYTPNESMLQPRTSRRQMMLGLAGLGAVGVGAAYGASAYFGRNDPLEDSLLANTTQPVSTPEDSGAQNVQATAPTEVPAKQDEAVSPTAEEAEPVAEPTTDPAANAGPVPLPPGMALVTSPRLPVFGVGEDDALSLLLGETTDWQDLGVPYPVEVRLFALEENVPEGMRTSQTFKTVDELVKAFGDSPGAVAYLPLDLVDHRVNVVAVGGFDPLRQLEDGENPIIRVAFVGDIVPGRNVAAKMAAYDDYTHPFKRVARELSGYDLAIANLEGNLSDDLKPPGDAHTFSFVAPTKMTEGLKMAGIDAVSLANNHTVWNADGWGAQGLLDTMQALDNAGIPYFGAGTDLGAARAPWVAEVRGRKIAILGVDGVTANEETSIGTVAGTVAATSDGPGTNPYVTSQFLDDIQQAASQYDIVIPYLHVGVEYVATPPEWALEGCRAAIDAGATMVVTNHPHVIQGMEIYNGKPIVYSVGNFVFDQMFSVEVRTGLILELVFRGSKLVGLRPKGIEIEDFQQPRLMSQVEHAALMDRFWRAADLLVED